MKSSSMTENKNNERSHSNIWHHDEKHRTQTPMRQQEYN